MMDAIDQALARLMTCAPAQCPRETDCWKIAKWALEQRRAAMGARPLPGSGLETEVPDYAPQWEAPRRILPDWDAA
ncbi:MAG: hypothetical protein NHG36_20155 [Chromatiaceae bacterium]|nr:hypothetical protein [Candidatus Thioaporhodococcus sediminis]